MLKKILKILIMSLFPLFEFELEDDTIWDDDTILM